MVGAVAPVIGENPPRDSLATPLSAEREFVYAYLNKDYLGVVLARGVRDAGAG
jgi:hypothetical protein